MEINLIIPRHPYGSLRDGAKRESLHLSPEGVAALDRLATCSRSAAADLAIRVSHAVIFGKPEEIWLIVQELAKALNNDGIAWTTNGLETMADMLGVMLNANLKVSLS